MLVAHVGTRDQNLLNRSGDDLLIDWGYFHLAVPAPCNRWSDETPSRVPLTDWYNTKTG